MTWGPIRGERSRQQSNGCRQREAVRPGPTRGQRELPLEACVRAHDASPSSGESNDDQIDERPVSAYAQGYLLRRKANLQKLAENGEERRVPRPQTRLRKTPRRNRTAR